MRRISWKVWLSLGLIGLSGALYALHYAIFRDTEHIFKYTLSDIAFIPIDVLLVVLVIHGIITGHEKKLMLKKLNMVFGAFYSEVGTELLRKFSAFDVHADELKTKMRLSQDWKEKEFTLLRRKLKDHDMTVDAKKGDLAALRQFLIAKREFLLRLLENPNLLEHEDFSNVLWAVFHLADELAARPQVTHLPDTDYDHLSGDIKRAYTRMVGEWVEYMKHLYKDYPFLFSLAMRTNPFDAAASAIVK